MPVIIGWFTEQQGECQDSVNSNGGLASLTVTDDGLTLTTADGYHGVDA
jgi:hypothetical protein